MFLLFLTLLTSAVAGSPGFDGFALDMTRTEALSLLRQRGVKDWFDIDEATHNGRSVPRRELIGRIQHATDKATKDTELKSLPCVMSRPLSRPGALSMECGFRPAPTEKLSLLSMVFYADRMERLDVYFHGADGKTMLKDLRTVLGASQSEGPAVLETGAHSIEQLACRDSFCKTTGWRKRRGGRDFSVTVVSRVQDPNEGRAISLHVAWSEVRTAKRATKQMAE